MYDNFHEKYKNSVFQILKICKAFNNFDFNSTIKKKIHWYIRKKIHCTIVWKSGHRKVFVN